MKINKFSVIAMLALGSLVASSNLANAQEKKGGARRGPSVDQRMERMTEELKLTDEQKPKVKAVLEDSDKQRKELFADSNAPREERREKMRAIMDKESKKLKEIFTADQFAKYEKMRDELRAKGGKKKGEEKKD